MPIKMLIVDGISVRNRPWPGELRYFNKDCCQDAAMDQPAIVRKASG